MAIPAFSDRRRFARRLGALAALIIVHAVLLGSGWVLAGDVGLLLAILVALVVEARLAKRRMTAVDRSPSSMARWPDHSDVPERHRVVDALDDRPGDEATRSPAATAGRR